MELLTSKIISICAFMFITLIVGSLTILLFSWHIVESNARRAIPVLKSLTGGLFLGIILLDLWPESNELIENVFGELFELPIGGIIIGLTIFLLLFTDKLAHGLTKKKKKTVHHHGRKDVAQTSPEENQLTTELSDTEKDIKVVPDRDEKAIKMENDLNELEEHEVESVTKCIIVTIVLCFHTVMEGLGLGLQRSTDQVFGLLIPLLLHQAILSFIYAVNLLRVKFSKWVTFVLVIILGLSAAVGSGLGTGFSEMQLNSDDPTMEMVNGVLLSVATGTLIYVTFYEMITFEHSKKHGALCGVYGQIAAAVIGFVIIGVLDYARAGSMVDLADFAKTNCSTKANE